MNPDPTPFDRLRAWCAGELPPDEARAFEAALAADPHLALAAEEYRAVHRLTEAASDALPTSAVTFDRLVLEETAAPQVASRGRSRWWVAAAAAVLALGAGLWLVREPAHAGPVELAAVPLAVAPAAAPPALLASYDPLRKGTDDVTTVRWLSSEEEAREVARYTHRPIFVYGMFPGCPWCKEMEDVTLRDESVVAVVPRFVPVRLDMSRVSEEKAREIMERGWPYFAVRSAEGETIREFPGRLGADAMKKRLEEALGAAPKGAEPLGWDDARASAAALAKSAEARRALLAARDLAPTDSAASRAGLEDAARRLAGTPYGADLARVLARWTEDGRFPDLVEAHR